VQAAHGPQLERHGELLRHLERQGQVPLEPLLRLGRQLPAEQPGEQALPPQLPGQVRLGLGWVWSPPQPT